jgi:AAA domain/CHC2 zinc finger
VNRIADAKARLPLPELLARCGLSDRAKKSARRPFHEDTHASFSVWRDADGRWLWKCHTGCGGGDEITFIELHESLSRRDAVKRFLEMAGVNGEVRRSTPRAAASFDWRSCVKAFTDEHAARVAKWRGYSIDFMKELRESEHIGIHKGLVAFPVCDNGKVVGAHVRAKNGKWFYAPDGIKAALMVFGEPVPGERVQVFESTWDGLDYMDKSGERDGVIIARGASNAKLVAPLIPEGATVYVWTQNDKPGANFETALVANTKCAVKRVKIPASHHDLNDWTRDGATVDDLIAAMVKAERLQREPNSLPPIQDAADMIASPIILPDDVIEGVLHRGAKMVFGGASKSYKTWTLLDLSVSVSTGVDWLGKFPTKRGRVLFINLELQAPFLAKRIRAICDERQLTIQPGYFKLWNLRGHAADLSKLLPLLLQQITPGEYALIIIDPVYKTLGQRDENKAGDIANLLNQVESLAVHTGAAAAFGAHYSKGNQALKEAIDRVGGSGVFARDPDTILNFTRHEEDDCFTVEATLRNHPPIDPFVVRWDFPLFAVASELDPNRLKQAGRREQHTAKDLLALIVGPMSATEIVSEAYEELQMPRRRVFECLTELKRAGLLLKQPGKRGKYEPVQNEKCGN